MLATQKLQVIFLAVILTVLPQLAVAQQVCKKDGYTISTVNGVFTDEEGARYNERMLKLVLKEEYKGEKLDYQYLLNPSHIDGLGDILKSIEQGAFGDDNIRDTDLLSMLNDANRQIKTQKILLVPHSQGNFYANAVYKAIVDQSGGLPAASVRIFGVASPATHVNGDGAWLTSSTDKVIAQYVNYVPFRKILPPNTSIKLKDSDDHLGHSFTDVYLKYRSREIVSGIRTSLGKLRADPNRVGNAPCIGIPKLTVADQIDGATLAAIDNRQGILDIPAAVIANTEIKIGFAVANMGDMMVRNVFGSALFAIKTTANAALATGHTIKMTALAVNSAVSSLLQRATSNIRYSVATDQSASTVLVTRNTQSAPLAQTSSSIIRTNKYAGAPRIDATPARLLAPVTSAPAVVPVGVSATNTSAPEKLAMNISPVTNSNPNFSGFGGGAPPQTQEVHQGTSVQVLTTQAQGADRTQVLGTQNSQAPAAPIADTIPPIITILGSRVATSTVGVPYTDAGATALDAVDGVRPVIVTSTVSTSTVGTYAVTYTARDLSGNIATSTRTVNIVPEIVKDTTPPVITILGADPTILLRNASYVDAGATALDAIDGARPVTASSTVDTSTIGTYAVTYTARDLSGNIATSTRTVKVSSYIYAPKYTFGTGNGDGHDWQVWAFNGSNVYDWSDTYVNGYLHEQFKLQTYSGGYSCARCLQLGVFPHDPQLGFEKADVIFPGLSGDPQNSGNDVTYDVSLEWDRTGYAYTITHGTTTDATGYARVPNMGSDAWVGWDDTFNNFTAFPSGTWAGVPHASPLARAGGEGMVTAPHPVYMPTKASTTPNLSLPATGAYAGTGITPTRGRAKVTPFSFQVVYADPTGNLPKSVTLHIASSSAATIDISLSQIARGTDFLSDGNVANGELYTVSGQRYPVADYTYYFTAEDSTGHQVRLPETGTLRFGVVPSTYTYVPKYTFGVGNGDGNDWQAWAFNGSNVYDWSDTYANGYLHQQFKIQAYGGGYLCIQCLQMGIFDHDPQLGFEKTDVIPWWLVGNPQNNSNNVVYDVSLTWDSTGYVYAVSHGATVDATGHVDVPNVHSPVWVGWDGALNNFTTFPSGVWQGVIHTDPLRHTGGTDMVLAPHPVYVPGLTTLPPSPAISPQPASGTLASTTQATAIKPLIDSYTFNGFAGDQVLSTTTLPVTIAMNASENVNWMTIWVENSASSTQNKVFHSDTTGCVDGTAVCTKVWKLDLSPQGTPIANGTYRIKVHMKDVANNEYMGYLSPYVITIALSP